MICTSCGAANPTGMRFCGMCGTKLMRDVLPRERRRVTSVFIDMAGFSTLTRDLDPEEMRDLADEVLTVVAGVIEAYDGYVDSFRGDGLIALFGAPHSHPDDPRRAVLAAAAGLAAIEEVGAARDLPLKGRAGVNTGVVIAGAVGSGRVRSYTVMGSAVNLAARLEQAAEPGEVWVGPETYQATHHRLLYEPTTPIELRGFPNVTSAHRLLLTPTFRQTDPYGHLRFVGRETEIGRLEEAVAEVVRSGAPLELRLHGEAGSGKTRLLREFDGRVKGAVRTLWIKLRPNEEFSWEPLGRQLFGLRLGEEERSAQSQVQGMLEDLLPQSVRWHRLILTSLDLAPAKAWTRLERRSTDRTALAWSDLVAAIPGRPGGPEALVLFVENEPKSPTLLEFLAALARCEAPVLIVRTSRGRAEEEGPNTIELPPLTRAQCLELLEEVTPPASRGVAEALIDQVGGVPAHVLELGRTLSITQDEAFSGSLAALLQARIDLLEPGPKRLLAHAALVGEVTWEGLLLALGGAGAAEAIRALEEENLLVAQNSSAIQGEVEYRFQSELLRSAVSRMVPYADRPLLHLKIATWLEEHAPLVFSELTARQFELGGSPDAAYGHYLAAADMAASRGEAGPTMRLYRALLDLELPAATLAEGALAYAQAALSLERPEEVNDALARSEELIARCSEERRGALLLVLERLQEDAVTPA